MLAFINPTTAYINVYYVIPIIYLLHILPFHIIILFKSKIYKDETTRNNNENDVSKALIIPDIFNKISKFFNEFSTFNPISPQGMLIFGLITSIYRLKYNKKGY
jgi:hypothetical protein